MALSVEDRSAPFCSKNDCSFQFLHNPFISILCQLKICSNLVTLMTLPEVFGRGLELL